MAVCVGKDMNVRVDKCEANTDTYNVNGGPCLLPSVVHVGPDDS